MRLIDNRAFSSSELEVSCHQQSSMEEEKKVHTLQEEINILKSQIPFTVAQKSTTETEHRSNEEKRILLPLKEEDVEGKLSKAKARLNQNLFSPYIMDRKLHRSKLRAKF